LSDRILIIDDDVRLAQMLVEYLTQRGLRVETRADATSGLVSATSGNFDAVILDVMLPDGDGFDVCRKLRGLSSIPILMLTARGDDEDRIVGLELGADDYLPKPFNPRELLARVRAILRRQRPNVASEPPAPLRRILQFGNLGIDPEAREVRVNGAAADLTSHQFALLWALVERRGRVQTRDQLMEAVRGTELDAFDRSIDVHISRIRSAIEQNPRKPRFIRTVRSEGYVFTVPEFDAPHDD
jgi:two-component system, OmpR family, phosphate regulon response regulator OmpR